MKLKKNIPASTSGASNRPSRLKEIITGGLPTLVIWNLLFILTCIPLITIGPAMAAFGFCANSLVEDDRPKNGAVQLYFSAFRASFLKALPVGIYFLLFTILFGAGFFVYSYLSPENAAYVSMSSISMVILSLFWGVMMHMYPLMFDFDKTDWENKKVFMRKIKLSELISESGRVAMYYWKRTALALVFVVLLFGSLLIFLPMTLPILVLVGFSAVAVAAALAHTDTPY